MKTVNEVITFSDKLGRGILLTIGLAVVLIGAAKIVSCQTAKSPEYKPTDMQILRLQVKQSQAQTKKVLRDHAQEEFNAAYGALMDEANAVKKENKWPVETLVDPDKLLFSAPPKPIPNPPAAPAKK